MNVTHETQLAARPCGRTVITGDLRIEAW